MRKAALSLGRAGLQVSLGFRYPIPDMPGDTRLHRAGTWSTRCSELLGCRPPGALPASWVSGHTESPLGFKVTGPSLSHRHRETAHNVGQASARPHVWSVVPESLSHTCPARTLL